MDHRTPEEKASPLPTSPGSLEDFLEPGPTYIAPGAGFIFGDVGSKKNLMDFLPSKVAADSLLEQYQKSVHYINRVVHWPSFQVQYDNFWTNVLLGIEPAASVQALVFSIMFSAVASMDDVDVASAFSRPKRAVLTNFQTGTEVALCKAHFLRSTKIEVIQALVIYLIPMCRSEMSRAHSVLVTMAIRLGECMGLHRDPKDIFGASPVEAHVRRAVWYQLCFLDIRTNEAQGPRPSIRRDDYDTKFPYNINDADLLSANPQDSDTAWTDMTISRMRFECNEMHRVVFVDRQRLEKKQISLTHVLGKIESFRKAMEAKYYPLFDPAVPIKSYARVVMEILILRMHIGVLHRYHNSVSNRIPDRLRQIILTSGTQLTENAVKLETMPEFKPWRWCAGAYQQYHTAFLLLVEIFAYPMRKEADRIWNCLDYVFKTDRTHSRAQRGRVILTELRDKIAVYRDIRKIRAPVSMMKRLYQRPPRRVNEATDPGLPLNGPSSEQPPDKLSALDKFDQEREKAQRDTLSPYSGAHLDYTTESSDHCAHRPSTDSPANSSSPSQTADPAFHTWTFDTPQTTFLGRGLGKDNWCDVPGLHSRGQVSATSPPTYSSPSAASTSDSWPPFITQGQNDWAGQMPQAQTIPPPQQQTQALQYQPSAPTREMASIPTITHIDADSNGNAGSMPVAPNASPNDLLMDIDWVKLSINPYIVPFLLPHLPQLTSTFTERMGQNLPTRCQHGHPKHAHRARLWQDNALTGKMTLPFNFLFEKMLITGK